MKRLESPHGHKYSFLISLVVTFLAVALFTHACLAEAQTWLALLTRSIELKTYDTRFRLRGRAEPSDQIVIVAIDEKTLDDLGSWPFSRLHYTRMLENLRADGAAVIGFDITFPKPDEKSELRGVLRAKQEYLRLTPPGQRNPAYLARLEVLERQADTDAQFAEALLETPNVVLGQFFYMDPSRVEHVDPEQQEEYEMVLPFATYTQVGPLSRSDGTLPAPLAETYTGLEAYMPQPNLMQFAEAVDFNFGYFNFVPDADAIARRTNLVIKYGQDFYPSLDVQVLRYFLGVPQREFGLFYNEAGVDHVQFGELRVPTDLAGRMVINYQGPAHTYRQVSLSDVAAGTFEPGTFTGKMVLVGPTATAIGDMHPVPLQAAGYPGVEIHANVLDTMLTQRFIRRGLREEVVDLAFILLFGLGIGFVLARVPPAYLIPVVALVLALFLGFTYIVFAHSRVWLNIVVPAAVLVANLISVTAFRLLLEEREKRKTRAVPQQ
ncbi:MAG: CHASE2 domain-containing protein [Terriglobia bacterium]